MKIITEPKALIGAYVARKQFRAMAWGEYSAVGLVRDNDELCAGVVFNGYTPPNILMHISADHITPGFVYAILHYAFVQINCTRITGMIEKQNHESRRFAKHLGAKLEGTMKGAAPSGDDYCIYGLYKERADKWLSPRYQRHLTMEIA